MKPLFSFVVVSISSLVCNLAYSAADESATAGTAVVSPAAAVAPAPLPLDHGPRAVTTPWANKQRLAARAAAGQEPQSTPAGAADYPILPLDHGPRAVTTPRANQQRLAAWAAARQKHQSAEAGVAKNQ